MTTPTIKTPKWAKVTLAGLTKKITYKGFAKQTENMNPNIVIDKPTMNSLWDSKCALLGRNETQAAIDAAVALGRTVERARREASKTAGATQAQIAAWGKEQKKKMGSAYSQKFQNTIQTGHTLDMSTKEHAPNAPSLLPSGTEGLSLQEGELSSYQESSADEKPMGAGENRGAGSDVVSEAGSRNSTVKGEDHDGAQHERAVVAAGKKNIEGTGKPAKDIKWHRKGDMLRGEEPKAFAKRCFEMALKADFSDEGIEQVVWQMMDMHRNPGHFSEAISDRFECKRRRV
ncbi:MAG: hypothetical protein M1812_003437 [Candelaria pacifica]|nr:MAG: hypothetical protein M1812_003437 [Candelaria pacifica]